MQSLLPRQTVFYSAYIYGDTTIANFDSNIIYLLGSNVITVYLPVLEDGNNGYYLYLHNDSLFDAEIIAQDPIDVPQPVIIPPGFTILIIADTGTAPYRWKSLFSSSNVPIIGSVSSVANTVSIGEALVVPPFTSTPRVKRLIAGSNISLVATSDDITIDSLALGTVASIENVGIGHQLVLPPYNITPTIRSLTGSSGITIVDSPDELTFLNTGVISINSSGTGISLINVLGANTLLKSLKYTLGISITSTADEITISNTGVLAVVRTVPTGATLIGNGIAPYPTLKTLVEGTNINLTETPDYIIVNASGVGSVNNTTTGFVLVVNTDPLNPLIKTLVAGSNISLSQTSTSITISSSGFITGISNASILGVPLVLNGFTSNPSILSLRSNTGISITTDGQSAFIANTGVLTVSNKSTGTPLVDNSSPSNPSVKTLVAGLNVSLSTSADSITISATGLGGVSSVQNASATGIQLVLPPFTSSPTVMSLLASTGILLTNNIDHVSIANTGVLSISSVGVGSSIVNAGSSLAALKSLIAGTGISITNGANDLTLINTGVVSVSNAIAGNTLVITTDPSNPVIKTLSAGTNITLTSFSDSIQISAIGTGATALTQLTDVNITLPIDKQALIYNAGTLKWINSNAINTLVNIGTGSTLLVNTGAYSVYDSAIKSLIASTGISITANTNDLTIANTGLLSLASVGAGSTIVVSGSGAATVKSFIASTGISIASNTNDLTIANTGVITVSNAAAGNTLVINTDPTNPTIKTLTAGTNITLTPLANSIQISAIDTGATALTQLTDVNISSPINKQALIYDSGTTKWINSNVINTLVNIGAGSTLLVNTGAYSVYDSAIKSIIDGVGISLSSTANDLTITNDGVITITNVGAGAQLIAGLSANPVVKSLIASTGISITNNANDLTFANTGVITVSNAAAGNTLVVNTDPTNPTVKTLVASTGISITNNATNLTITNTGPTTLAALTDVNITSPVSKQGLVYDSGTTKWINTNIVNTLVNIGSGQTLVVNTGLYSVYDSAIKSIIAGTGISLSPSATDLTINNTGVITVSNAAAGNTLVVNTDPANPTIKVITASTGINIANNLNNLTITNSGLISLASVGTGSSIVVSGSGAATVKSFIASTGISITNNANDLTFANTGVITVSNAAAGNTLVINTDPANPSIKTLTAGANITLTPLANSIQIDSTDTGATALTQLTDVNISSPINKQALIYDSGTTKWINSNAVNTLVNIGTGSTLLVNTGAYSVYDSAIKSIIASTGISITANANDLTIANTGLLSLASVGAGSTIVVGGSGAATVKSFIAGSGISITNNANDLTFAGTGILTNTTDDTNVITPTAGTIRLSGNGSTRSGILTALGSASNVAQFFNQRDVSPYVVYPNTAPYNTVLNNAYTSIKTAYDAAVAAGFGTADASGNATNPIDIIVLPGTYTEAGTIVLKAGVNIIGLADTGNMSITNFYGNINVSGLNIQCNTIGYSTISNIRFTPTDGVSASANVFSAATTGNAGTNFINCIWRNDANTTVNTQVFTLIHTLSVCLTNCLINSKNNSATSGVIYLDNAAILVIESCRNQLVVAGDKFIHAVATYTGTITVNNSNIGSIINVLAGTTTNLYNVSASTTTLSSTTNNIFKSTLTTLSGGNMTIMDSALTSANIGTLSMRNSTIGALTSTTTLLYLCNTGNINTGATTIYASSTGTIDTTTIDIYGSVIGNINTSTTTNIYGSSAGSITATTATIYGSSTGSVTATTATIYGSLATTIATTTATVYGSNTGNITSATTIVYGSTTGTINAATITNIYSSVTSNITSAASNIFSSTTGTVGTGTATIYGSNTGNINTTTTNIYSSATGTINTSAATNIYSSATGNVGTSAATNIYSSATGNVNTSATTNIYGSATGTLTNTAGSLSVYSSSVTSTTSSVNLLAIGSSLGTISATGTGHTITIDSCIGLETTLTGTSGTNTFTILASSVGATTLTSTAGTNTYNIVSSITGTIDNTGTITANIIGCKTGNITLIGTPTTTVASCTTGTLSITGASTSITILSTISSTFTISSSASATILIDGTNGAAPTITTNGGSLHILGTYLSGTGTLTGNSGTNLWYISGSTFDTPTFTGNATTTIFMSGSTCTLGTTVSNLTPYIVGCNFINGYTASSTTTSTMFHIGCNFLGIFAQITLGNSAAYIFAGCSIPTIMNLNNTTFTASSIGVRLIGCNIGAQININNGNGASTSTTVSNLFIGCYLDTINIPSTAPSFSATRIHGCRVGSITSTNSNTDHLIYLSSCKSTQSPASSISSNNSSIYFVGCSLESSNLLTTSPAASTTINVFLYNTYLTGGIHTFYATLNATLVNSTIGTLIVDNTASSTTTLTAIGSSSGNFAILPTSGTTTLNLTNCSIGAILPQTNNQTALTINAFQCSIAGITLDAGRTITTMNITVTDSYVAGITCPTGSPTTSNITTYNSRITSFSYTTTATTNLSITHIDTTCDGAYTITSVSATTPSFISNKLYIGGNYTFSLTASSAYTYIMNRVDFNGVFAYTSNHTNGSVVTNNIYLYNCTFLSTSNVGAVYPNGITVDNSSATGFLLVPFITNCIFTRLLLMGSINSVITGCIFLSQSNLGTNAFSHTLNIADDSPAQTTYNTLNMSNCTLYGDPSINVATSDVINIITSARRNINLNNVIMIHRSTTGVAGACFKCNWGNATNPTCNFIGCQFISNSNTANISYSFNADVTSGTIDNYSGCQIISTSTTARALVDYFSTGATVGAVNRTINFTNCDISSGADPNTTSTTIGLITFSNQAAIRMFNCNLLSQTQHLSSMTTTTAVSSTTGIYFYNCTSTIIVGLTTSRVLYWNTTVTQAGINTVRMANCLLSLNASTSTMQSAIAGSVCGRGPGNSNAVVVGANSGTNFTFNQVGTGI